MNENRIAGNEITINSYLSYLKPSKIILNAKEEIDDSLQEIDFIYLFDDLKLLKENFLNTQKKIFLITNEKIKGFKFLKEKDVGEIIKKEFEITEEISFDKIEENIYFYLLKYRSIKHDFYIFKKNEENFIKFIYAKYFSCKNEFQKVLLNLLYDHFQKTGNNTSVFFLFLEKFFLKS